MIKTELEIVQHSNIQEWIEKLKNDTRQKLQQIANEKIWLMEDNTSVELESILE